MRTAPAPTNFTSMAVCAIETTFVPLPAEPIPSMPPLTIATEDH